MLVLLAQLSTSLFLSPSLVSHHRSAGRLPVGRRTPAIVACDATRDGEESIADSGIGISDRTLHRWRSLCQGVLAKARLNTALEEGHKEEDDHLASYRQVRRVSYVAHRVSHEGSDVLGELGLGGSPGSSPPRALSPPVSLQQFQRDDD